MQKQVLVISGPTGCGESTITNELTRRFPGRFVRLVTATTRSPRGNEEHGIDYFFMSKDQFLDAKAKGDILEYGYIPNRDAYYGSYRPDLEGKLAKGLNVIANTQIVGTKYYKENYNATTIFIYSDLEELRGRLRARDKELSLEELERRIQNAKDEIEIEGPYYDYRVINANGRLEDAIQEVLAILSKEGYL